MSKPVFSTPPHLVRDLKLFGRLYGANLVSVTDHILLERDTDEFELPITITVDDYISPENGGFCSDDFESHCSYIRITESRASWYEAYRLARCLVQGRDTITAGFDCDFKIPCRIVEDLGEPA